MIAQVFVITIFCITASYQYTPYVKCQNGPNPLELRVENCTTSLCKFVRGYDVKAQWDFNVVADTENLRTIVSVVIPGFEIDYPYPNPDACQSLVNAECPLQKDTVVTYDLRMPISPSYPKIKFSVTFNLVDDNNNVHSCFTVHAQVVDPPKILKRKNFNYIYN